MTRFPPGFSSIVYIILICSSGWSVAEHYKPKLLSNNLDHTKTNLYQFCLPVDELVLLDQKNAYLEITSPDPLSYVAIDWEGGTSGLDLVWYPDGQSEVLRVPLILGEEYQNGWKPNLKTPSCIDGFIVSSDEISKLTLAMSNLPASAYTSQKDACPSCDSLEECNICTSGSSCYPIGCDGLPAMSECLNTGAYFTGNVSLVFALLGLLPVFCFSMFFFVFMLKYRKYLIRAEREEEDEMDEHECALDPAQETFVASPLQV